MRPPWEYEEPPVNYIECEHCHINLPEQEVSQHPHSGMDYCKPCMKIVLEMDKEEEPDYDAPDKYELAERQHWIQHNLK